MNAVTTNLEKIFFAKILEDTSQFEKVEPDYFENQQIRLVYDVIRDNFLKSTNRIVATPKQILTMVNMVDPTFPKEVLRVILSETTDEYNEQWVNDEFKKWKIRAYANNAFSKTIEIFKGINNIDSLDEINAKINQIINGFDISEISDDDEDLGLDFDDPESHKLPPSKRKLPTGWSSLDTILGGGWDINTLNVLMGETNIGKSFWLQNIGVNLVDEGYNVLYVTLEMSDRKVTRRMGRMRFNIDNNKYDELSKDSTFMKNKINEAKNASSGNSLFDDKKSGVLFIKKFATSDCTVTDLDNYVKKFEQKKKIKIHALLVDYINIMSIEKGYDFHNMLYLKGKHLAEGLRRLADKRDLCVITLTQVDKAVWGANDLTLADIPESKAIAETADSFWGIIQNTEMKKQSKYRLKILKLRDGEHKNEQILFDFDTRKNVRLDNDRILTAAS